MSTDALQRGSFSGSANLEDIYKKLIGRALTDRDGLAMKEVVGTQAGQQLGAIFFPGSKPIDAVWATEDIKIMDGSVMPAGYGIGDHQLFVVDIQVESLIGSSPHTIV